MKNFFKNIFNSGSKKAPTAQDQLSELLHQRQVLARELDRIEEKKQAIIVNGVNLTGSKAQINRDEYDAACSEAKLKQAQFTILGTQIKNLRKQIELEGMVIPPQVDIDIAKLEELQIKLEMQQEQMEETQRRMAELTERQNKLYDKWAGTDNDTASEYDRLVAEAMLKEAAKPEAEAQPEELSEYDRMVAEARQAQEAEKIYESEKTEDNAEA